MPIPLRYLVVSYPELLTPVLEFKLNLDEAGSHDEDCRAKADRLLGGIGRR